MNIRNIAVALLSLIMLASCSSDKQRLDYRTSGVQVSPLEIPPDLTSIAASEQYSIPGANGESVASFSDYTKGVAALPGNGGEGDAVLPDLKKRHMERSGLQHWIVVEDKAENVWPGLKTFWRELGFKIPVDNPQAGVMETDWLENHGNVPKSYVRQLQGNGKAIDILKSEGIRNQYVTRIERSKDGLATEIHISLQVMQEVQSANRKEVKWLAQASDPETEIAMLQLLMVKLVSENAPVLPKNEVHAASAVVAAPAVETIVADIVQLKETASGNIIQISAPFDRGWRKVGLALDHAHIVTSDKDRSKGIYFVVLPQDKKDTKKNKQLQSDYLVMVRENSGGCEVAVTDQNGKSDAESARIIEALYASLNSGNTGRAPAGDKPDMPSGNAVRPSR